MKSKRQISSKKTVNKSTDTLSIPIPVTIPVIIPIPKENSITCKPITQESFNKKECDNQKKNDRIYLDIVIPDVPKMLTFLFDDDKTQSDQGSKPHVGSVVSVDVRQRIRLGVVWSIHDGTQCDQGFIDKVKPVDKVWPLTLDDQLRHYLTVISRYYLQPIASVVAMALTTTNNISALMLDNYVAKISSTSKPHKKTTHTPQKLLLNQHQQSAHERLWDYVYHRVSPNKKVVNTTTANTAPPLNSSLISAETSSSAGSAGRSTLQKNSPRAVLLKGPAGSGKTEIYISIIQKYLKTTHHQGQIVVLVPEIALVHPLYQRFEKYGIDSIPWHSHLTPAKRRDHWWQIVKGHAHVIIGTRSALHLPYHCLSLLVVDEEHENAYKQDESTPYYHGRDMAITRAHHNGCGVILVSATPCVETMVNIASGKYCLVDLHQRYFTAPKPAITIADLRPTIAKSKPTSSPDTPSMTKPPVEPLVATSPVGPPIGNPLVGSQAERIFTPQAITTITQTINNSQQVLVYLNRRGYAPMVVCYGCQKAVECLHCSVPMALHHRRHGTIHRHSLDSSYQPQHHSAFGEHEVLLCHYCGFMRQPLKKCPSCAQQTLFCEHGIGVDKLADIIQNMFPDARLAVAASDHLRGKKKLAAFYESVYHQRVDIIVGTQIMAKGHHFPHLTAVIVVNADMGLNSGDFRSHEVLYQNLYQIAGRAGREHHRGQVVVQTFQPQGWLASLIPTIHDAETMEKFYQHEISQRDHLRLPPFAYYALVYVRGPKIQDVQEYCQVMTKSMPPRARKTNNQVMVFPPSAAPIEKIKRQYRYRFLLKSNQRGQLQHWINLWLQAKPKPPTAISVNVDIDPVHFF